MEDDNIQELSFQEKLENALKNRVGVFKSKQTFKEALREALAYALGFDWVDGTYVYTLNRVKSGFSHGTITLEDFEEFSDSNVDDLVDSIISHMGPLIKNLSED